MVRAWHGIVSGNVSETLRSLCTHISPNHLLERGYGGSTCTCSNISPDTNDITSTLGGYRMGTTLAPADSMYFTYEAAM